MSIAVICATDCRWIYFSPPLPPVQSPSIDLPLPALVQRERRGAAHSGSLSEIRRGPSPRRRHLYSLYPHALLAQWPDQSGGRQQFRVERLKTRRSARSMVRPAVRRRVLMTARPPSSAMTNRRLPCALVVGVYKTACDRQTWAEPWFWCRTMVRTTNYSSTM